jgi:hypothetical protein
VRVAAPKPLMIADDHGPALTVSPDHFAPKTQDRGWGAFAETFLRTNDQAFRELQIEPRVEAGATGSVVRLIPGALAGAMPLRSGQTGRVAGGIVVRPRFGWSGVGRVLREVGWHAAPTFSDLPLVPGSGREVPPWVLAGPVLARLAELLRNVRRGYRTAREVLTRPRGHIDWPQYVSRSLATGRWHRLPCEFPDLSNDPHLRSLVKWCLDRVRRDLAIVGGTELNARALVAISDRLIESLRDVPMLLPRKAELDAFSTRAAVNLDVSLRQGLEAMGWVVEERGLGGGREMDGLAWRLSLPELWESYVEAVLRTESARVGANVRTARRRETTLPIIWSTAGVRSMSHLAPDFIVRNGGKLQIVDAKYKAHFAELDESGWYRMRDDARESHRADFLQALAYASVFDAKETIVTLVYPLRRQTFDTLKARGRDVAHAEISYGGRPVRAELRGLPFGGMIQ